MDEQGHHHHILIPEITVAAAAMTGCPLMHACVLLDLESGGGRNVYGTPKKPCGMTRYTEVTEANYREYLARRDGCGTQGVGVLQLTNRGLQDQAQSEGGTWRPEINMRVGLREFTRLLARHGVNGAYSAYNTGKPGFSPYLDKALALLPRWRQVIDSATGEA